MAYSKKFNPDALPAHAEPDQAAQALAALEANRKPSPHLSSEQQASQNQHENRTSPPPRRVPPLPGAQQSSRPLSAHLKQNSTQSTFRPGPSTLLDDSASRDRLHSPPPPANYGQGPRPTPPPKTDSHDRRGSNPLSTYPPRTARPPSPDSVDLYPFFRAANVSGTGVLTAQELSAALVNSDYTTFDPVTIRTMMRLFSSHPSDATVTFSEFENLWRFLAAWRELFERFDEDQSGRISLGEFSKALTAFGYRLSQPFVGVLYNSFNDRALQRAAEERRGSAGSGAVGPARGQGMTFDLFVQACISLKRMTDVFKGYDEDRDGYVTLSFEEFLTEILRLRD